MKQLPALIVLLAAAGSPAPASAQMFGQMERYELGQRLRRFELAWQSADGERRDKSVPAMEAAVSSFFRLQLATAGRSLDQAYLNVLAAEPSPAWNWALSQRLQVDPLVADASETTIRVRLHDFYPSGTPEPTEARIALRVLGADQKTLTETRIDVAAARQGAVWETGPLAQGDHHLVAVLECEEKPHEFARVMISRVDRWQERKTKLAERLSAVRETASPTGLATCEQLLARLESLGAGRAHEADCPARHLLETCEGLLETGGRSERYLGIDRSGDYLLTLSNGRQRVPVRIRVPDRASKPMPVLLAFHGAGGSENMFFETYGAGRLVRLGAERGWLVVAPRLGLLGLSMDCRQMLDVLAEHFPVDRERVFLVGHSMGAVQVVNQVSKVPESVTAAVALGGGMSVANADAAKSVPWLVAAGERDFGRRGGQALARGLEAVGADVRWLEVPNVEHMVVVQAALDDVFSFLDEASRKTPRAAE
ncbi:MAG: alpha/beta fold hydrolase [Planctomycetes bacterium]|nr:alpha/beta fold hydrolase [Planctomycetota bacterium]